MAHSRFGGSVWDRCPGFSGRILAHFPTFLKLGLRQGLMHQLEIRIYSVWEVGVQGAGLEHPP